VIERVNSSCGKMKEYAGGSSEMEEQVRGYISNLRLVRLKSATRLGKEANEYIRQQEHALRASQRSDKN
jgi:hypothetical protein